MRGLLGVGVVAAGVLLGAAAAKPVAKPASYFDREPTNGALRQALPASTVKDGVSGRAVLRCHWTVAGALSDCVTISELPQGAGFGPALMSLIGDFHMSAEALKRLPPGSLILVTGGWESADTGADWVRRPSAADIVGVWPHQAAERGSNGRAVINCAVSTQGALFDCVPTYEDPVGAGFGAAAMALSRQFAMRPATRQGQPVLSFVNLPINWEGGGYGFQTRPVLDPAMAWREAPTYADMAEAYPKKARASKLAGHATVTCEFDGSGRLRDCNAISEQPKGEGFGVAAQKLAKKFEAPATTVAGKPISKFLVEIPMTFDPQVLSEEKPAVGKARWAGLPSDEAIRAAFGEVAKATNSDVRVMLTCTVEQGGVLTGCEAGREDPPGHGVAPAALALTAQFKVATWTAEGLPTVGGRINIPLKFVAAPAGPEAASSSPAKP